MVLDDSARVLFSSLFSGQGSATLAAAIIGFLGGVFSTFGIYFVRKRERKKKLRKTLLVELQIPKEIIDRAAEMDPDDIQDIETPTHTGLPTSVHDSHINDLGLLSSYELEPIITYYSGADVASEQLEHFDETASRESFIEETALNLKEARDKAEERIKLSQTRLGWINRKYHDWKTED